MASTEASGVVAGSIRGTVRNRLLQLVGGVEATQKVVILDEATVKIIDATVSMPEILDSGVFLIENVSIGRQPYPSMAAIYIVRATHENVASIGRDFAPPEKRLASGRTGPMYSEAHLLFTSTVDKSLLAELAQSPVAPYVKSFQELYIEFVPAESRAFHLGADATIFRKIFAPMIADGPESPELCAMLDSIAVKIASACATIGEIPSVRYRKSNEDIRSSKLAIRVQQQLEDLSKKLNLKAGSGKQSTLIIVDRTVDLVAPLLHEFTVQAMANDLVGLGADGSRYAYTFSSSSGPQTKTVSLDERDSMWTLLRHAHIAECSDLIIERFNKFMTENKAAVKSRKAGEGSEDVTSLAELKETMAALGEFQEMKSEYALHLSIAQDCLSASDKKKLIEVAGVEQDMATGLDSEGDPVKDVWNELAAILDRPALTSADRARLVMIYLLTQPKLGDADKLALFAHAKLEDHQSEAVRQLVVLAQGRNYRQRQPNKAKGSKRKSIVNEPSKYDVSRFIPAIKVILEDAACNELDLNEFPSVKPDAGGPTAAGSSNERAAPVSLRAKPAASAAPAASSGSVSSGASGPIFLFILGEMTYSEMRCIYELSVQLKRDFYIGSGATLTPCQFLDRLGSASK